MSTIPAQSVPASSAAASEAEGVEVIRPAGRSVIVIAFGWLVLASMFAIVCFGVVMMGGPGDGRSALLLLPILLFVVVLLLAAAIRGTLRYEMTASRVRSARGVFRRSSVEIRLDDVRNVVVGRSFMQRVLRLGTIRMIAAGVGPGVVWNHVDEPEALAARVRAAIDGSRGGARPAAKLNASSDSIPVLRSPISPALPVPTPVTTPAAPIAFPVIGLAGGIGAGKSAVAAAFARQGCFVIDSDVRSKAALDREDVRDALVSWWGPGILTDDGRVDRKRVASIVFTNAGEREKLEGLIHPIVRDDRAQMVREAREAGAVAAIVDAPLLFEAGVDAECDCVVFVDSPREVRLERVQRTRGWDEAELERREAAQWTLQEKRARSRFVVDNRGDVGLLDAQVGQILAELRGRSGSAGETRES